MAEEKETKLEDMIRTSLESIRTMVDANTVVGTPITTPSGTTVIPVSKVSVGYASGGIDFDGKQADKKKNFGGGGGTGLTVQPVCFISVNAAGEAEVLTLGTAGAPDSVEKLANLIEKAPDILGKIKSLFPRKKKKKEAEMEEEMETLAHDAAESVKDAAERAEEAAEHAETAADIAKEAAESAETAADAAKEVAKE